MAETLPQYLMGVLGGHSVHSEQASQPGDEVDDGCGDRRGMVRGAGCRADNPEIEDSFPGKEHEATLSCLVWEKGEKKGSGHTA
jgi:hypothetical protein